MGVLNTAGSTILAVSLLSSAVVAGSLVGLAISFRNLPDVRLLQGYIPSETTHIYDIKGTPLASLHSEENREVVPLDDISPQLKRAVLAIEDSNFYEHGGVNPVGIARATLVNIRSGRTVEGASTLTQQLAKNLFLSPEQAITRKLSEAVLALRMEKVFEKDEILEKYLNQVYWGHNTYGVETAAESYFNKSAADLTLGEAAMMAGIIQAPEAFSPFVDFEVAKRRQEIVLNRMLELGWITASEAEVARNETLQLGQITSFTRSRSPFVTNTVVQELTDRFGQEALMRGGLRVQTTVDINMQEAAERTVQEWHQILYSQGVYADQMALVAVDPRTHFVKAIVGGVDKNKTEFNRATQAIRQPGSAFKPFVFYTAFASGQYAPDSSIDDSPVSFDDGSYERYVPQNYDRTFAGTMSIRAALAQSRNIPAITLGQRVGLEKVIDVCRVMGIKSPMPPVISLPLGSVDLTPLEMAAAYATFASNGWQSPTTAIAQVTDSSGRLLLDNTPKPQLVLDPWAAAALNQTMTSVITEGTGRSANIGRQAAGKTGTTSSERDIWFVGHVPQLSVAVWAGNDDYTRIGQGATGGGFMAPVWADFMRQALRDQPVEYFKPASNFTRPASQ
ncbi:PBP1A family penicillin-binding protein [Synechococcales cyanobacterium C]|uniref:PBP1A family penicillin-binding protein n=1 Tax=Petrachloros mirabilis ULC683 TaxID=2781853 RepID=A0A8K2A1P8_9CYAN|nr:penicillin-binding protein 1A [Petrachloros mirabilis]NCJ08218.1 PBP1A family penicillin-binding protein [Petrachloros mirabilis ULC683]